MAVLCESAETRMDTGFPFDGLKTPTPGAAGSNPVGRAKNKRGLCKGSLLFFVGEEFSEMTDTER